MEGAEFAQDLFFTIQEGRKIDLDNELGYLGQQRKIALEDQTLTEEERLAINDKFDAIGIYIKSYEGRLFYVTLFVGDDMI